MDASMLVIVRIMIEHNNDSIMTMTQQKKMNTQKPLE